MVGTWEDSGASVEAGWGSTSKITSCFVARYGFASLNRDGGVCSCGGCAYRGCWE